MSEYITDYESKIGKIQIAATEEAVTGLWFYGQKYFASTLEQEYEKKNILIFDEIKEWLDRYFSGENLQVTFPVALKGSDFRQSVWRILREIPYGETMTYGEIAKKIAGERGQSGMSAQAVGGAVGHNPISIIIPCHRVVGAGGSLTGYAGGIEKKKWLLALESKNYI